MVHYTQMGTTEAIERKGETMSETKRAPMPWAVDHIGEVYIRSASGLTVCQMAYMGISDAEFIVLACNSHDDLLAACEESSQTLRLAETRMLERDGEPSIGSRLLFRQRQQVDAAIAKAKGES